MERQEEQTASQNAKVLMELDLFDEFRLMIDPLLVGGGQRRFPDDGTLRPIELVDHEALGDQNFDV